eukprot:2319602-Prymnesium_polylepis.1
MPRALACTFRDAGAVACGRRQPSCGRSVCGVVRLAFRSKPVSPRRAGAGPGGCVPHRRSM